MAEAYACAEREIIASTKQEGDLLDCGAHSGHTFDRLNRSHTFDKTRYHGIEWHPDHVAVGRDRGLDILQGDLNRPLPFEDRSFQCISALSVLEHLLNGCQFIRECHRVTEDGGKLVLLTPNISTFFTAALVLMGKMPSSGPHPDSDALMKSEEVFKVSSETLQWDTEADIPVHRHLVVFSFRILGKYLRMTGFRNVRGYGFGLYPFPRFSQKMLQRLDPYHCHQMVFVAEK